jgi:hypothetical protein
MVVIMELGVCSPRRVTCIKRILMTSRKGGGWTGVGTAAKAGLSVGTYGTPEGTPWIRSIFDIPGQGLSSEGEHALATAGGTPALLLQPLVFQTGSICERTDNQIEDL